MADTSDVLNRITEARTRIGSAIAIADQTLGETANLKSDIGERFASLKEDFDRSLDHFESEAHRARQAAREVIDALLATGTAVSGQTHDIRNAIDLLRDNVSAATEHSVTGNEVIVARVQDLISRLSATQGFIAAGDAAVSQGEKDYRDLGAKLESSIGKWTGDLNGRSSSQRMTLDQSIQELAAVDLVQFKNEMEQSVAKADTELNSEESQIVDLCEQEGEEIQNDRENARDELESTIENMSNALDSLGDLVSSTAGTLTQGADEATDLVQLTSVGIDVVIGLLENLKQIFDEIEEAWA